MSFLPVMLELTGRRVLIVGGGGVACRRASTFLEYRATVSMVAIRFDDAARQLDVDKAERPYRPGDLDGAFAVCTATDDPELNERIANEARARDVLVNRCDDGPAGDFTVPAHARRGPITVAVDTGGASASTASTLRDELLGQIDPSLPALLEVAAGWRKRLRRADLDTGRRSGLLKRLTGPEGSRILQDGGPDAVNAWMETLVAESPAGDPTSPT